MSSDRRLRGPILDDPNLLSFAMLLREVDRFPEQVPARRHSSGLRGMLSAAIQVAQALGRAQGAALYVVHDDGPALAACTVDASRLLHAFETCRGAFQSGCQTSGFVPAPGGGTLARKLTFTALPLFRGTRVVGVLYLERLAEMSDRVEALVRTCAEVIAGMLEPPRWLAGTDAEPGSSKRRVGCERPGR